MDFLEILERPEGKTLEFKRDLSSPDGVLRTVVAFANSAGGTLLLGVEDKGRRVRGVAGPLATGERLASLLSDRIAPRLVPEIEILPFGLTVKDLPHGVSKLRNRVIGRVFHALGMIEQWGSGIQRMTAACREAGLAAPVFEELATRFRVTIATERVGPPLLDETDEAILACLADGQGWLTSEIAAEQAQGGEFLTPHSVVDLLVEMIEPYRGRVYDPCCGSGGMFVQSMKFIRAHATASTATCLRQAVTSATRPRRTTASRSRRR